jgi:hypothetical protein
MPAAQSSGRSPLNRTRIKWPEVCLGWAGRGPMDWLNSGPDPNRYKICNRTTFAYSASDSLGAKALPAGHRAVEGKKMAKRYKLVGADGQPYESDLPGALGGYRPERIYGRLDCSSALRALAKGGYAGKRVFFPDEETAIATGYRPCGKCMKTEFLLWKQKNSIGPGSGQHWRKRPRGHLAPDKRAF